MLLSFSVENFLSIQDRVELSLLAADFDKSLPENIWMQKHNLTGP